MAKYSLGLANIFQSVMGAGSTLGSAWEAIGSTVPETAQMNTDDDTVTDFGIEESTTPIISYISEYGKTTFNWSTYDVSAANLFRLFGGTLNQRKTVSALGAITGGTGYTNGNYYDIPLTGGSGSNLRVDIVVAGGAVTTVTIRNGGEDYTLNDALGVAASNLGGSGSGFATSVSTVSNPSATQSIWLAPQTKATLEKSLRIVTPRGFTLEIQHALLAVKPNFSFTKTKPSQIDISASVLAPDNGGWPYRTLTTA